MMMKFNFGCGPLVLKGTSCDGDGCALICIELEDRYADIPMETIVNLAEKLYSTFNVSYVSLYKDDMCICTIDKEEEEDE